MKKKLWIYITLAALLIPAAGHAQSWRLKRYTGVIGIGSTHSFMDIGPQRPHITSFQLPGTRPNVAVALGYRIFEPLCIKLSLEYIQFGGVDNYEAISVHRFVANAFEPSLRAELEIWGGMRRIVSGALFDRRGMVNNYNSFNLYIFGGVGGLLSKAKGFDTEGNPTQSPYFDNNMYFNPVFPVGAGMCYNLDSDWMLGIEFGYRFTFTDNIDGYHTEWSQYNDKYMLTNVKAIYKIRTSRNGLPQFRRYPRRR